MATSQTIDNPQRSNGFAGTAIRRTIAAYRDYASAERAVDWLSDQGFAVEHTAIVGKGLRSVEQIEGRMSIGRAALIGAGEGGLLGMLFALLFGVLFTGPDFAGLLAYSVVLAGCSAPASALSTHGAVSGGRRDFVSATNIEADRYEVQVDGAVADEAKRLLSAMPPGDLRPARSSRSAPDAHGI